MPVLESAVTPKLCCGKPGCELTTFTTRANLKRHTQSKHGTAIKLSCGKTLPNHKSNIKRHQKSCKTLCTALDQLSTSTQQVGFGSVTSTTTSATRTVDFDFNHGFYPVESGDMDILIDDFNFGDH
ncbi:hypothetical protein CLIM01_11650 [Colletotrichum limetticola]|uniref:C2H2-type domain-containing protein n=1 Tax=Colletotrichum limetticola TaxID=1209924 RepID=A0ABQ9PGQ3_9PEZI|nr:hypothetical protein CLIM01_11650 [Colletotrichum limetticola]